MSAHVLTDAHLWIGDVSVGAFSQSMQWDAGVETQDATVFGASARVMAAGLETVSVSADGLASSDDVQGRLRTLLKGATVTPLSASHTGAAVGDTAFTSTGLMVQLQPWGGSVGDLSQVTVQAEGAGGVVSVEGQILHPETAETESDTNSGANLLSALQANETLYAALHVLDVDGTNPTLDVIIEQDEHEFPTPTTVATFTQATGPTAEFVTVPGPGPGDETGFRFRANWTISGTNPSFTFVVIAGIV